jgi:hypothetical protein
MNCLSSSAWAGWMIFGKPLYARTVDHCSLACSPLDRHESWFGPQVVAVEASLSDPATIGWSVESAERL